MKEHPIKPDKLIGKIRGKLENKIEQDNKKICRFFEDSFGKPAEEIDESEIEGTYLYMNPVITTEDGRELEGWDEIKSFLETVPGGTQCEVEEVEIEIDYLEAADPDGLVKNDFDLHAHVKTAFNFGGTEMSAGSDPGGEGDLRHRRTCVWEP